MQIVLTGINHKTAAVEIRERLACDAQMVCDALAGLKQTYPDCEFVLLSTCNRVECVAAVEKEKGPSPQELAKRLAEFRGVAFEQIEEYLYVKTNEDAVTHLFTVTSSLDSMVIGENQITSQVRESYKLACKCETTGKILNRLFHEAFRTNKEIVTKTSIANRRVSVAGVAVDLAKQLFSDVQRAKVVIAGAGEMGELLVEHFVHEGCEDVTVVNRSEKRGCSLAQRHDVSYRAWEKLDEELTAANIVVSAASAQDGFMFDKPRIKRIMHARRNPLLLAIDITVPRSFDPAVGKLDDVYLYCIDDLAQVAKDNIKLREGDLEQAIEIIYDSVSSFMDWFATCDVGPWIGQMKDAFEKICEIEMGKFFVGPRENADCQQAMQASMRRVINKLCHCVIENIDDVSKEYGAEDAQKLAQSIFENAKKIIDEDKPKDES